MLVMTSRLFQFNGPDSRDAGSPITYPNFNIAFSVSPAAFWSYSFALSGNSA